MLNMLANDVTRIYTNKIIDNGVEYQKGDLVIDAEIASELFNLSPEYDKVLVKVNGDKIKLYGVNNNKTEIPVSYKDASSRLMLEDWYAVTRSIDGLINKPDNLYTGESLEVLTYDTEDTGLDYNIKLSYIKTDVKGLYKLKSQTKDNVYVSYTWLDNDEANDLIKHHAIISTEKLNHDYGAEFLSSLK